jgi:hypothetical protein
MSDNLFLFLVILLCVATCDRCQGCRDNVRQPVEVRCDCSGAAP